MSGKKRVVFVEPASTHLHVYSWPTIPRLGSAFARIGLLFTENLDRIRQAYTRAGEMLELWGDGPAASPPVRLPTSG